jgi:hypothetical protein
MNLDVPANDNDCYNQIEHKMWCILMDVMSKHDEEVMNNPHIEKNNPAIIHPKSYIILYKNISEGEEDV